MTFHSTSMVELGRVFVGLTESLNRGGLEQGLEMLRQTFDAEAVFTNISSPMKQRGPFYNLAARKGSSIEIATLVASSGTITDPRNCHAVSLSHINPTSGVRYNMRLYRAETGASFNIEERGLLDLLLAQMAQTCEAEYARQQHSAERSLFSGLLDRLQAGVIMLDGTGQVCSVSTRASEILAQRDGVQILGSKLSALHPAEDKALQTMIRNALARRSSGEGTKGLSLTRKSSARKMGLVLRGLDEARADLPNIAVYIRDADIAPDVEANLMRQIFDLTPAEAAVARGLADGLSLEDTALALDISRNTARAHLRSIFSKSGIKRQTELVRLVLNSAVVL